ncbi:hypothetical protein [Variovorax sp. JS1663]|uniref:hypothetical protein n=1 Tax=Variovorax sp. JS1663 TaxID=1851577 RepID=UPI000B346911|nr:hypothetical protein [Variovorax sp. JS1663]OUM01341.1 hypothetical protein A8M77_16375 [Variovorax sp. JS1663]
MADERLALTPQQRLTISRRAIVDQLQGPRRDSDEAVEAAQSRLGRGATAFEGVQWLQVTRQLAQRWWRRHPANAAGQLARPLLERYAREQPTRLMAAAAGAGALVVLVKPWRLLSVTAVLAALLKTSDVADLVTTLMHKTPHPARKDSP